VRRVLDSARKHRWGCRIKSAIPYYRAAPFSHLRMPSFGEQAHCAHCRVETVDPPTSERNEVRRKRTGWLTDSRIGPRPHVVLAIPRRTSRSRARGVLIMIVCGATLSGCTADSMHLASRNTAIISQRPAADPAPSVLAPVLARYGDPQLVTTGSQVAAKLPEGTEWVTVLEPEINPINGGHLDSNRTNATISFQFFSTFKPATSPPGLLPLSAAEFSCRDGNGHLIPLRTTQSSQGNQTSPGLLKLTGVFYAGYAELTWKHHGAKIASWTFTVQTPRSAN
jgi:hypothetical protein